MNFVVCTTCGHEYCQAIPNKDGVKKSIGRAFTRLLRAGEISGCVRCGHVMAIEAGKTRNLHRDEAERIGKSRAFPAFCKAREKIFGGLIG